MKILQFGSILLLSFASLNAQTTKIGLTWSAPTATHSNPAPPAIKTIIYRSLGDAINWNNVNTAAATYNTTNLDLAVNNVISQEINDFTFELTNTPTFASSNPTDSNCTASLGACDPPSDLNADGTGTNAYFKAYCTFLMTHARATWPSLTRRYELWNEPSAGPQQWTGTNAQLVRMLQDAITIRNSVDPSGLIISSAFSGLFRHSGQVAFSSFVNAGGTTGADRVGFHGYVQNGTGGNNPVDILNVVIGFLRGFSFPQKLVNTEYSWLQTSNFSGDQVAFVGQSLLLQQVSDIEFVNWYAWNYPDGTLVTDINGGSNLNPAGIAFQNMVNTWLTPASSLPAPCSLSGTTYTCGIKGLSTLGNVMAVWSTSGTGTYNFPMQSYATSTDLLGNVTNTVNAASVNLTSRPIFLTPAAPVTPPGTGPKKRPWWWRFCHCGV